MKEKINPLDELLPIIASAVAEWKSDSTPAQVKARVKKQLSLDYSVNTDSQ